jgi:hypothetical protein
MPHKDRKARLAYLRRWKVTGRPSPSEEPQADPSLPPRGPHRIFAVRGQGPMPCLRALVWLS